MQEDSLPDFTDRIRRTTNQDLGIHEWYDDVLEYELAGLNGGCEEELAYLAQQDSLQKAVLDRQYEETMRQLSGRPVKVIYNRSKADIAALKQEAADNFLVAEARENGTYYWAYYKSEDGLNIERDCGTWQTCRPRLYVAR